MFEIKSIDQKNLKNIQKKIDHKTKPPGSLGQLEDLAKQLSLIIAVDDKIEIKLPTMLVFAGDHGIAEEGVSIAPSAVTQQMVINFLNGGAAINCFCRTNEMALQVINAGILLPVENENLINQPLGCGTNNFSKQPAMTVSKVEEGLKLGASVVCEQASKGTNVFGFGEMGIGNSTSAAAIMSATLALPVIDCVGYGTGITDDVKANKVQLIEKALEIHSKKLECPFDILACLGGFEIVQMVGAMLEAGEQRCIVLVDGFIATVAALVATKINRNVRDYMVFCHQSKEKGHRLLLQSMDANPLLSLGLCLGEGTGVALALPLLRSAACFYNDMASFENAGIEAV